VAEETEGMNAQQVKDYFAAARALQDATEKTVRVHRAKRSRSTAKR
jgi:adenosyl cobinamide kinase/adenosyl cobinamide phosphate guanylyltransferase